MASRTGNFLIHLLIITLILAAMLFIFSLDGGSEIAIGNLVLRAQNGSSAALEAPPPSRLAAAPFELTGGVVPEDLPRNVIVILGDGMGIGMVSAASQLLSPPGVPLHMEQAPVVGLMHTWAANILATDSAAAATAMATGYKTDKGVLGLLPDGRAVRNLFEVARDTGFATAVVTTSGLADATPGGFLSHVASRNDHHTILTQIFDSGVDVLIGGDWSENPKSKRNDTYLELLGTAESLGAEHGYSVVRDRTAMATAHAPLVALLPPRPEMPLQHGPPLAETASLALDLLENDGRPYVALIETEVTDETGHSNDMARTLDGMRELEETVALVIERTAFKHDTLVVVVADHETGGPHLIEGEYADEYAIVRWAHKYHSTQLVPVFAFGPGSAAFSGVLDNTAFSTRIAALLNLENFPVLADSLQN